MSKNRITGGRISANEINYQFKKLIKVDNVYLNSRQTEFTSINFDDGYLEITINESYFNTEFYAKFYPKYYNSKYRSNSQSRKQLHKHLLEKWQEVIKMIYNDYIERFDIYFHFNNPHNDGDKIASYDIDNIEYILPDIVFEENNSFYYGY